VNRAASRIQNKIYRFAFLGGGALFAYATLEEFISPFIPLVITVIGSLIAGSLVRYIFVCLFNRRLVSNYRYTNTSTDRQSGRTRVDNAKSRKANRTASGDENVNSINTPPDSLSLYRNLLGLGPRFTAEELKTAYRNAAAMYHPDRYASATRRERENAEDLMKKVNEAYENLKAAAAT